MLLVRIFPDKPGYEQRTYKCPWCPHQMTEFCCVNELATRLMAKQHFSRPADMGGNKTDNNPAPATATPEKIPIPGAQITKIEVKV
jgi:hypothetical protein